MVPNRAKYHIKYVCCICNASRDLIPYAEACNFPRGRPPPRVFFTTFELYKDTKSRKILHILSIHTKAVFYSGTGSSKCYFQTRSTFKQKFNSDKLDFPCPLLGNLIFLYGHSLINCRKHSRGILTNRAAKCI